MIFVDTNVWSLAFRRDGDPSSPLVKRLGQALQSGGALSTGLVVQELFQGLEGPRNRDELLRVIRSVTMVRPRMEDHLAAAEVVRSCRRGGVQVKTVDALLAALCIRRGVPMLTADRDFEHVARHAPLELWEPAAA